MHPPPKPPAATDVDDLVVIRLWRVLEAFDLRLASELERIGLTVSSFRLVGEVMRAPDGIRQTELARRLRIRPASVSTAVSRLVDDGILRREVDVDDPRAVRVRLDPRAPLGPGLEILFALEDELLKGLGPRDRADLERHLDAMHERLTSTLEPLP